jgi:transposase-like protein
MDLAKRAAVFRVAVRRLGTRGVGRRYPEELKREALGYLGERRRQGAGLGRAASELGVRKRTLRLWAIAPRPSRKATFVPMAVVGDGAPSAGAIVVHARGLRVEGLDVAALADLLRRLA